MFTTVSSDGVVCSWMLVKNELQRSELTRLVSTDETVDKVGEEKRLRVKMYFCVCVNVWMCVDVCGLWIVRCVRVKYWLMIRFLFGTHV